MQRKAKGVILPGSNDLLSPSLLFLLEVRGATVVQFAPFSDESAMNGSFQFWWWRNFGFSTGACVCTRNW